MNRYVAGGVASSALAALILVLVVAARLHGLSFVPEALFGQLP